MLDGPKSAKDGLKLRSQAHCFTDAAETEQNKQKKPRMCSVVLNIITLKITPKTSSEVIFVVIFVVIIVSWWGH